MLLNSNGPFSHDSNIAAQIHLGAEGVKHQLTESDHGGASLTAAGNARNTHLDSQQSVQACSTCLRGPQEKTPNAGFNLQPRRDSSNRSTHLHFTSAISQPSKENANSIAAMWTSNTETHEGGQTPKMAKLRRWPNSEDGQPQWRLFKQYQDPTKHGLKISTG